MLPIVLSILLLTALWGLQSSAKLYFYIYDWPSMLDDLWPPDQYPLHPKSGYVHDFRPNNGSGKQLNSEVGLYLTWQFSIYKNIVSRLRVSDHRTLDPAKASAFIVPFDAGVHSYIDHLDGHPRLAAPHGRQAGQLLRDACNGEQADIFWKYRGHDHFVIFSITAYQMVGMQVKSFLMFVCQNCTVITIETSPTKTAIPGRTRKSYYAAPYPSSFHWHEGIKHEPWTLEGQLDSSGTPAPQRDILAMFIGSVKTAQPTSTSLRRTLNSQCALDKDCQWHNTPHACNGVANSTDVMLLIRRTKFCPAPSGDSITRKSIFDSLVGGCIPVIFARATLSQYSWHLSDQDVDDVAVYIPMKKIEEGTNFLHVLRAMSPEEVRRKQEAVARIAPRLQYSVIPERVATAPPGTVTWRPPFRDAVDVIVERIVDPSTVDPLDGYSNQELMRQHMEQKAIMQQHEDYAALRPKEKNQGNFKHVTINDVDVKTANSHTSITYVVDVCKSIPLNNTADLAMRAAHWGRSSVDGKGSQGATIGGIGNKPSTSSPLLAEETGMRARSQHLGSGPGVYRGSAKGSAKEEDTFREAQPGKSRRNNGVDKGPGKKFRVAKSRGSA